jgi:putative oxidoreductase
VDAKVRCAIDIEEGDVIDEEALKNRRGVIAVCREGRKATFMGDSEVRIEQGPSRALDTTRTGDFAILALRLAVGVVLAYHGWLKIPDVSGFAGFVDSLGVPAPELMAYVVTYLEFLGGIALILGLGTRYVAALFVIEMAFTIMLVKVDVGLIAPEGGPGAELDILILAIALSLVLTGAGRWSVDAFLAGRRRVTDSTVQRHVE